MTVHLAETADQPFNFLSDFSLNKVFTEDVLNFLLAKSLLVLAGIVLLVVGFYLTKYLVRLLKRAMRRAKIDPSLASFLGSACSIGIKILIIISVASMLGVETSAFVAVIGAAGLAIGLALQGSLSNFAGGVLILIFKPFKVGDIISTNNQEGEVEHIDILYTKIIGYDNKVIVAPNGNLANSMLVNLSEKENRRMEIPIRISHKSDINAARIIILQVFAEDPRVVNLPAPVAIMKSLEESHIHISARCWCNMTDYFEVYWDCLEKIKEGISKSNEVEIPFPQRDLYLREKPDKPDSI